MLRLIKPLSQSIETQSPKTLHHFECPNTEALPHSHNHLREVKEERDSNRRQVYLRTGFNRVDTWIRVNDPSAGSPTETLLRLLLPLNDQV
jgi:hypothetical protein